MPEPRAIGDQTWKMRFLRRRALVCDAKLGGLGAAATRAAAEGSSMAPRQFLVRHCCFDSFSLRGLFFFLKAWTRWKEEEKHKRGQLVLAVKIIRRGNFIEANGREMLRPAREEIFYNFRVKLCCSSTLIISVSFFPSK